MAFKVIRIDDSNLHLYDFLDLEREIIYPYGADFFSIDHGQNYLSFFQRMGQVHYYAVYDTVKRQIAAVGCGVLRSKPIRCWYLCDLKVRKEYRGQRLPLKLLSKTFFLNYWRCQRAYTISMNDADAAENRVLRLLRKFRWAPLRHATNLEIFSFGANDYSNVRAITKSFRGNSGLLSLNGIKDLKMQSSGKMLPLYHLQFGPGAEIYSYQLPDDAVIMFCTPANDRLSKAMVKAGFQATATATVIHHRMNHVDWSFILTSEI